jgi:ribosomal protein S18 acetylase RimI-like enzyme
MGKATGVKNMKEKVILSSELLEQIIYGMENQGEYFCLDVEKLALIHRNQKEEEDPEELRYLSLPRWTPADGYNIMERFVLSLNNPLYRTRLKSILHSGKGVFRNFKNLLKEKPEIEKLWFHYKNKELRGYIQEWLDSFENYRTMMSLGEAEENLEELILSDFLFLNSPTHHQIEVEELDSMVLSSLEAELPMEIEEDVFFYRRMNERSSFLTAESPEKELAGFIIFQIEENTALVTNIYTVPEFRGLKIAEELYCKMEELLLSRRIEHIFIERVQAQSLLNHFLVEKEFEPQIITYSKKLKENY